MRNASYVNSRREVVFIDADIEISNLLATPVKDRADVVMLAGDENGLQQMRSYLIGRQGLTAIHLLSHGAPGRVQAGATRLDADSAGRHAGTLREITASLCADGELLLYGCEAGAGAEGGELLSTLRRITGARVAANSRPTGSAELGGSWHLDTGALPVRSTLLNAASMRAYHGLLAAPADENYNANSGYLVTADTFTLNGIKYTITGSNPGNYTNTVTNNTSISPLGNNAGDYFLCFDLAGAFGISSIKIEAADGSAFRMASLSYDMAADTTVNFTPGGGGSAVSITSNGAMTGAQSQFFGAAFENITYFTVSGGNLTLFIDDLDFEAAVVAGPSVASIARVGAALSNGSSVNYTVTFSESVTGVDASDFALAATGTAAGSVASVSGSGSTYTVTVNSAVGDGTLRLDLNSSGTGIQNGASAAITGGYTSGQTFTLDHTAPSTPAAPAMSGGTDTGSSNSDAITSSANPVFGGTVEANATVTLYDTDGTTVLGSASANGAGVYSITSSTLTEGSHDITVKVSDAAGNVSSRSAVLAVSRDTVGPTALALASTTVNIAAATNGATVTTASATDASSISYSFATGNGVIDADNAKFSFSGDALVAAQTLAAGAYHIYVKATDAAGNDAFQFFVINVVDAPSVSSVVRAASASATVPTAATAIDYTVTFSQTVTGVDISDFGLSASGNASGTIAAVSGSGSTYTVTVNAVGGDGTLRLDLNGSGTGIQNGSAVAIAGGYTSGQSFTLDHTAPSAPAAPAMTSGTDSGIANNDAITSNTTPVFTGSGEANSTVRLYDSDGTTLLGTASADGAGNWSIGSGTLTAGSHSLTVKQTDAAGNVSAASAALAVVVDTAAAAAPAAPVLAGASDSGSIGDGITSHATPTITGTAEANATVSLYDTDGTTVLGTASADGAGAWSIVASTLGEGGHTLTVKQTDPAGNVSLASAGLALTIDTLLPPPPGMPVLAGASDSGSLGDGITYFSAPLITGSASANATVKLYDSDGVTVLGTATADGAGNWSITSSTLSLGAHALTARQLDLAGNVSAAGESLALTIQAPPEPPQPPATTVDGVAVTQQPATLPDGGSGTQIVVPIVTNDRPESSGSAGVADIPLVVNSSGNLLLAQVATGFGLTATGGASEPAGDSVERLVKSIVAATPDHPASDQGHLTGNGVSFLSQLAATVPLLVQTIVPTSGATAPSGTLTLTGTSSNSQHTALVIDTSHLAPGSSLLLKSVDFAAIVGSAIVSGSTDGQILTGDAASQQFIVPGGSGGAVFAGGGSDILRFTSPPAGAGGAQQARAAALPAGTTVLHGGLGDDNAVFNGASSDYTVEDHGGFVLVTAKTQPTQHALVLNVETLKFSDTTVAVQSPASLAAITGLYHDVLGRQADHLGAEFWAAKAANGASLGEIALGIISSAESQSLHPMQFNGNSAHDVELLYQAIFSRHSDSGGLAFWIDYMATGATLAQVAQGFLASDEMTLHKIGVQNWDFLMST